MSVQNLLSLDVIKKLSLPSNFKYGEAIFKRSGVEIINEEPDAVEAWVGGLDGSVAEGGSQRRRTRLYINNASLAWHCTGNPKAHDIFCKHCVALSLALLSTTSKTRNK